MFCVFIHGPAAAGKLTVARALQSLSGLPLHHNHLIVDAVLSLFPFGSEPFIQLREQLWLSVFRQAGAAGRSFIFTFTPESTVRRSLIDDLIAAIEAGGGRVLFVELTCRDEEIERRMGATDRAKYGKLNSLELYRQLRDDGAFEFPPMPAPALSIATDRVTPPEAARIIHARVNGIANE